MPRRFSRTDTNMFKRTLPFVIDWEAQQDHMPIYWYSRFVSHRVGELRVKLEFVFPQPSIFSRWLLRKLAWHQRKRHGWYLHSDEIAVKHD